MLKNFHSASFEISAAKLVQCPGASVPEIVFVGRSNAGKSTAINTLCNHRQLAFASKTPGRTQLLNFFTVKYEGNVVARLVDLPGYGFAQLSKEEQARWDAELGGYLGQRPSLVGCVIIVDARRSLMPLDWAMIDWLRQRRTPIHIVLSKADKLTHQEKVETLRGVRMQVDPLVKGGHAITAQIWSALKKTGLQELETQLKQWIGHGMPSAPDEQPDTDLPPSNPAPSTP
jgi:GTP-binding protein